MARIELKGISKQYLSKAPAVHSLDLSIEDGEFFGLLGPSGSGKTTVLRMIAALERPTSGQIMFDGASVERRTPQERNVAMVFEQNALYPHMTVWQNISYPLRIRKLPREEVVESVSRITELLGISHLLDRRPSQMSGGEQQRVAVARALVRTPTVCCMDEPIAHLDTALRSRLRGDLKRLQQSLGITSVIVTHDPIEAMTMTDRVAVMREGVLQQVGTPREIHARPRNAFVARFFGLHTMNQLSVSLDRSGPDAGTGVVGGTRFTIPQRLQEVIGRDRSEVTVGIRPEFVKVYKGPGTSSPSTATVELRGSIYVSEVLGEGNFVRVRIGDEMVHAITPSAGSFDIDEPVTVCLPIEHLYAFDGESGETISCPSKVAAASVQV